MTNHRKIVVARCAAEEHEFDSHLDESNFDGCCFWSQSQGGADAGGEIAPYNPLKDHK